MSTEELGRILADRASLVIDARPFIEYAVSHVPGALNVSAKPDVPRSVYVSDVREIERLVGGDRTRSLVRYCNGPFRGKSKRLSEELFEAGFTRVRRYQLGIPVWRALGGFTQIEREGIKYVYAGDRTAVFLDARDPEAFSVGLCSAPRGSARGLRLRGQEHARERDRAGMLERRARRAREIRLRLDAAERRRFDQEGIPVTW